jgi:hypothetical protein
VSHTNNCCVWKMFALPLPEARPVRLGRESVGSAVSRRCKLPVSGILPRGVGCQILWVAVAASCQRWKPCSWFSFLFFFMLCALPPAFSLFGPVHLIHSCVSSYSLRALYYYGIDVLFLFLNKLWKLSSHLRGCIQTFPDWVDNEINNNNKYSLRNNTKSYGGKTHWTDSQNSDTTAPSGRELYHLEFSLQAASPETFVYTLVCLGKNCDNSI